MSNERFAQTDSAGFTTSTVSAVVFEEVPMDFIICLLGSKGKETILMVVDRIQGKTICKRCISSANQSEALNKCGEHDEFAKARRRMKEFAGKRRQDIEFKLQDSKQIALANLDEKGLIWDGAIVVIENGDGIARDDRLAVEENIWPVKSLRRSKKKR
ncbi:hypothetical protein HAX54_024514 [Datura stramonium]|uniref:Uncharacterized protein n=1 Tax=Datura stramonium TaxID=4076 RepID=A0ABS8UZM3_DATST|nr:hypothetical protein [Datura stramonium]